MASAVLDASAVLAWIQQEDGTDIVEQHLTNGSTIIGAANWSEVAQTIAAAGGSWPVARALLDSYDVEVAPITRDDAQAAAGLWRRGSGLSLGDRLCLALADRLGVDAVTADTAWAELDRVVLIR